MRLLDRYIVFSSVFALFTEDFSFHYGIDWKLFYLIIAINFLILSIKKNLFLHKNIGVVLGFLAVHGVVSFIIFKNPFSSLISQLVGISFCSIYYYSFLRTYGSKFLFKEYANTAFYLAILALPMFVLKINMFTPGRLNGIMSEPAHYATVMLPALYVLFRQKHFYKAAIIFVTILLSKSFIGFIGVFLILVIPLLKVKYFLKYAIVVFAVLCASGYYISLYWNEKPIEGNENFLVLRIKDTQASLEAVYTGKFENTTNLSSYALLSNTFIASHIFYEHPLGTGLGSYQYEYQKRYNLLSPPPYLIELKQSKINQQDANSLFLRILADLGVFGLLFVGFFVYKSILLFKKDTRVIQQGAFFYLAIKLVREGHYFPPEFYFLTLIFLKDFDEDTTYS
ncbi:hypothetical protein GCM10011416_08570 [Polaribacter pacificus]|uniref:O-antigen ligase-related domain-containing protein n=1 Tax=Polaribacter pacificus TaxID=1775173 RepID=A0A917MC22_9FLAO|nr:O-antigen ligase family protein [Polaribacter pacificus]GGG93660.1 hypothetical protein GCM10011416_08570 [Polaribacter pacificus]